MLSYEEELAISELIAARREVQDELEKTGNGPSPDQRKIIKVGDAAASQLVEAYLPAIRAMASSMLAKSSSPNVSFGDLVNQGVVEAMLRTNKFDARRGSRFATYASPAITKAMGRLMAKMSIPVSMDVSVIISSYVWNAARDELRVKLGREPSQEQIEEHCNIDSGYISNVPTAATFYNIDESDNPDDVVRSIEQYAEATHEYTKQESALRYALSEVFNEEIAEHMALYFGIDRMYPRDRDELAIDAGISKRAATAKIKLFNSLIVHPMYRVAIMNKLKEFGYTSDSMPEPVTAV